MNRIPLPDLGNILASLNLRFVRSLFASNPILLQMRLELFVDILLQDVWLVVFHIHQSFLPAQM
jgi:hypothetical protein